MKVLKLSAQGLPQSWISLEQAVIHYASDEVRWEVGAQVAVFRGGHNAITGQQSQIAVGWAEILAAGNVAAFGIYNSQVPGLPNTEATVALEARQPTSWIVPYDNSAGFVTGVAIANTTSSAVAVTAVLRDESGQQVASSALLNLRAMGHMAFSLLDQFPALNGRAGTILLQNTSGATSAALGLRFNPSGTFTSLPVTASQ